MESAFISLSELDLIEISESKRKNRKILAKLLSNRERLLSTILIGNNVVNIAASALNTTLAIHYAPDLGLSEELAVTIANVILVLVILMFGEITPKSVAIVHNRRLSLLVAPLIYALSVVLTPVVFVFDRMSKGINHLLTRRKDPAPAISESTVINVVSKGEELGVIKQSEKTLIQNVFLFDEREVYSVMTPRTAVFALSDDCELGEVKDQLLEKQFSRIPIYHDSIDNITGILNLKTAFRHLLSDEDQVKIIELAQKPLFIYETMSLSSLLEQFKAEQYHMAIVVDEFGGMAGIVTLEDILEELVGEIYDEKDKTTSLIRQVTETKWFINGKTDIITINKSINGEIPVEGDYETIQGLIMSRLGRIPVVGDNLRLKQHILTVKTMKKNEIISVIVEFLPESGAEDNQDE